MHFTKKKKTRQTKITPPKKKTKKEINLESLRHFHYLLNLFGLNSKAWKVHLIPAKIIEETNTHSSKIRKMNLSHISWKIRYLSTVIMKFKVLGSSGSFWTPKPEPLLAARSQTSSKYPVPYMIPKSLPSIRSRRCYLWSVNEWTELGAAPGCWAPAKVPSACSDLRTLPCPSQWLCFTERDNFL